MPHTLFNICVQLIVVSPSTFSGSRLWAWGFVGCVGFGLVSPINLFELIFMLRDLNHICLHSSVADKGPSVIFCSEGCRRARVRRINVIFVNFGLALLVGNIACVKVHFIVLLFIVELIVSL